MSIKSIKVKENGRHELDEMESDKANFYHGSQYIFLHTTTITNKLSLFVGSSLYILPPPQGSISCYKSLTLPNATRFRITSCIFAMIAGTTVNSPYRSFTWSAALAKDFESSLVSSNSPSCSGVEGCKS
jgi:hypothetical protein